MLINIAFTIIITLMNIIFGIIAPLFPVIDTTEIYMYIDKFFELVTVGLNGFHFLMGDLPFILAPIIMAIYIYYYTMFIPARFIIKTVLS